METFKIYSLSNFQICNTVLLTLVTMLYVTSPGLIYLITGSLYLLTPFTQFTRPLPPAPASGDYHLLSVCIYELGFWFCFVF